MKPALPPWERHPAGPWALAGGVAVLLGSSLLACLSCRGVGDWDFFNYVALVARRAIVDDGELPLFNPFHCGGAGQLQNLQSRIASPTILLTLAFGPFAGPRLYVVLALALGFEGARRLARTLGAGPWGSLLVAVVVVGNGGVALRLAVGHLGDVPYLLLPWVWLGLRRGLDDVPRGVLLGAAFLAWSIVEAGFYPALYGMLAGGVAMGAVAARRRSWRPIVVVVAVAALAAMLSAVQVLPAGLFMLEHGRGVVGSESISLVGLGKALLWRAAPLDGAVYFDGQLWRWHEYGAYVGPVFVVAVLFGAVTAGRRALPFLFGGAAALAFALGDIGALSPWSLVHQLPLFSTLRASGRLLLVALPLLAFAGALGFDKRFGRWAPALVIALAIDLTVLFIPTVSAGLDAPKPLATTASEFAQSASDKHRRSMTVDHQTTMVDDVADNRGILVCYDPLPPKVRAQERSSEVLVRGPATATLVERTMSSLTLDVEASGPAAIDLNLNASDAWMVDDPDVRVGDIEGRLALAVPAGTRRVTVRYQPGAVSAGATITVLGLGAYGWLMRRRRLKPMG